MSRTITIAAVDRADLTRLESFSFQESAYRGEVGQGGFDVESPAGAVTVGAWKDVVASDTDGGRIFTGQTIDRGVGRGSFTTDAEATWDVQIVDINTILDDPLLRGDEWNRPEETDVARMQFLATWLAGEGYAIGDDYIDTANPETLDAYNYKKTGSYPRTIADTCAEQTNKNFYLFYDEGVTDQVQLFYGAIIGNSRTSAYRISSVLEDIDDYGVTWPAEWPEESGMQRDPSRVYSAVQVIYGTTPSQVFVERPATEAAFKRRETSLFDDSVTGSTSATRLANAYLDNAESEEDTITVAVTLPTTHVNAFQHGQSIQVKFPHLGVDDFAWWYCVRRTIEPAGDESKAPDRYHVVLVLKEGVKVTRFGGRGDQPEEPPGETDEPADTETTACVGFTKYKVERFDPADGSGPSGDVNVDAGGGDVGSYVYYNIAYAACGCPIGGGGWRGWHDVEVWWEFTAPADDPKYTGLAGEIDLTSTTLDPAGGYAGPLEIAFHPGAANYLVTPTVIGGAAIGAPVPFYVPRSLVAWGGTCSILVRPAWQCVHDAFYCNEAGSYIAPYDDGRGSSGNYKPFTLTNICASQFVTGATGSSGWVAGYGDVDGINATFTLIDWSGTGTVEASINGLVQPNIEVTLDTGAGTATFSSPPPDGAIVLFLYTVAAA